MREQEKTTQSEAIQDKWHSLSIQVVEDALKTSSDGLSPDAVLRRRGVYGRNQLTKQYKDNFVKQTVRQLRNPLVFILILATVITFALQEYLDASVILLAVLVAVIVGVIQEGKASRAFDKLASSQVYRTTVVRQNKKHEIDSSELVPGDVVVLQGGMRVPADIRLFETKKLLINESLLTGEWLAVKKEVNEVSSNAPQIDRTNMAWMGTSASGGFGIGYVVATGNRTSVGKLARSLDMRDQALTPLQQEIASVTQIMLVIVVVLISLIFLLGLTSNIEFEEVLLTAIAIAVASVPEGLPAAVTIILAVGMETLLKRGGLVRNLLAAETLGSTTYVLTDKTGTLTEGKMALTDLIYANQANAASGSWTHDDAMHFLVHIATAAVGAYVDEDENQRTVLRGESMECAVLESALKLGIIKTNQQAVADRIDYLAFTSENRFAAGLMAGAEKNKLCVNGAPELLLKEASFVRTDEGVVEKRQTHTDYFTQSIEKVAKEGKRVMAVTYKEVDYINIPNQKADVLESLIFVGILIFSDPVRSDVAEAITGVKNAGAKVRLVTGDNRETALSIARAVGISRPEDIALTGDEVSELSDDELLETTKTVRVFARILPRQKLRLTRVLQTGGEIVAMTGDGINDAPALQKANIGIAVGSGTEVAKEASDLILVNNSFSTIYAAIEEGRRIIDNLRKIVAYLLSTSLTEAVLIAVALITSGPIPILPVQILWANMIEEGLMSVAFAFEKGGKKSMLRKPQNIREEGILSKHTMVFIAATVILVSAMLLSLYAYLRLIDTPLEELRSVMFLAISVDSLFIAFSFRSLSEPVWATRFKDNKFFFLSFSINCVLLAVVVSVPFLHSFLSYTPLPFELFILPILYGAAAMITVEFSKWLLLTRKANRV